MSAEMTAQEAAAEMSKQLMQRMAPDEEPASSKTCKGKCQDCRQHSEQMQASNKICPPCNSLRSRMNRVKARVGDAAIDALKRCDSFCVAGCKRKKGLLVSCDQCLKWFHCQCVGLLVARGVLEGAFETSGECREAEVRAFGVGLLRCVEDREDGS